jgi:hypothetical protein
VALTAAITAWCLLIAAVLVALAGPFSFPSLHLSISGPSRLLAAAGVLIAMALAVSGPRALLTALSASDAPYVTTFLLVIVLVSGVLVSRGATSVGGADSAGYLAQAARWQAGRVRVPLPLAIPGLRAAASIQSSLGFRPDPDGTATVPSYPPGLPWLQAAALRLGHEPAAVRGVPLVAAIAALAGVFLLALPHAGVAGAALAAALLASLPPFLFQALQPMSDVPALAAWLLALAFASRRGTAALVVSALLTLTAILIRPNLAPLAAVVCWQAFAPTTDAQDAVSRDPRRHRLTRAAVVALGAGIGVAAVGIAQAMLYGSPLHSGYGRASELFSLAHVAVNVMLYPRWVIEAIAAPTVLALVAGAGLLALRSIRSPALRPPLLMAVLTVVLYLVYAPFDSWTYLRFVLIPLAIGVAGAAVLCGAAWRRLHAAARAPVFGAALLLLAIPNLQRARELGVFDVRAREWRYQAAGTFVRDHVPPDAVVVAAQHSTSVPYYSGRHILRADLLDATSLAAVVEWAAGERRPVAFVFDTTEVAAWHTRVGRDGIAAIDWPPRAEIGRPVATRVWISDDRAAYLSGAQAPTTRLVAMP